MDFIVITLLVAYVICAMFGFTFFCWYVSDYHGFAYRNRWWLWIFSIALWPIEYPIVAIFSYIRSKEEYDSYLA